MHWGKYWGHSSHCTWPRHIWVKAILNLQISLGEMENMTVTNPCPSPVLSYQVLLAIPCMECVMFNIRFTYLKTADATRDSFCQYFTFYTPCWAEPRVLSSHAGLATFLSPLCWDKLSFAATAVLSHTLRYPPSFSGTLPLPISPETSSNLGIYWAITFHPLEFSQSQSPS